MPSPSCPHLHPHYEALPDQRTSPPCIACSACPCAYPWKPTKSDKDTKLSVHFKCSYYSKTLLRQRCLTIIIPIIIAVGSTIIIPATTLFASVTITHYAFFFLKCFSLLCCHSLTLGSDGDHCRVTLGQDHIGFFSPLIRKLRCDYC